MREFTILPFSYVIPKRDYVKGCALMSLDRKDVRCKLDPNELEALKEICDFDGQDIGEWVEQLILLEINRRAEEAAKAIALHERLARLGVSGKNREKPGIAGSDRDGQGGRR